MSDQKIGEIMDGLGISIDLDNGDIVSDALVITKCVDKNGEVSVGIWKAEASTWFDQMALLHAASEVFRASADWGAREDDA